MGKTKLTVPPVVIVSEEIIEELKRKIVTSRDSGKACKKAVLWLIDQSNSLERSCLSFIDLGAVSLETGSGIIDGIHSMNSLLRTTRLDDWFKRQEISACLKSLWSRSKMRIWIAVKEDSDEYGYGKNMSEIPFDWAAIQKIDLDKYR